MPINSRALADALIGTAGSCAIDAPPPFSGAGDTGRWGGGSDSAEVCGLPPGQDYEREPGRTNENTVRTWTDGVKAKLKCGVNKKQADE